MIKSELIKDPCDLYIKYSVTIDLDTLEVIHQKLINACYTEIEYRFSARHTNYTCNEISEIFRFRIFFSTKNEDRFPKRRAVYPKVVSQIQRYYHWHCRLNHREFHLRIHKKIKNILLLI